MKRLLCLLMIFFSVQTMRAWAYTERYSLYNDTPENAENVGKITASGIDYDDFERYFIFDAKAFDLNRQMLAAKFCNFLKNNKLLPSEHLCGIAGMRT